MTAEEINEKGAVTKALKYLKSKHNGELPYRFGQLEIGKWMARYAEQERQEHAIKLLEYLYDSTADEFSQEILEAIGAENYELIYDLWINQQGEKPWVNG